jgi:endonuclease/exonuclease/phosphatase family metal-dependent hydrolase
MSTSQPSTPDEGTCTEVATALADKQVDIAVVTEIHGMQEEGALRTTPVDAEGKQVKYKFYMPKGKYGVALAVRCELDTAADGRVLCGVRDVRHVTPRIVKCLIETAGFNIPLVGVYAEQKRPQDMLDQLAVRHLLGRRTIVMGDFNAHIQNTSETRSENGIALEQYIEAKGLFDVTKTGRIGKRRHAFTWQGHNARRGTAPIRQSFTGRSTIDYIFADYHRYHFSHARAYWSLLNSDHRMVRARIHLAEPLRKQTESVISKVRRDKMFPRTNIDRLGSKAGNEAKKQQMKSNSFGPLAYIQESTYKMIRKTCMAARKKRQSLEHAAEYKKNKKASDKAIKKDRNQSLEDAAMKAQEHLRIHHLHDGFAQVRHITKEPKPSSSCPSNAALKRMIRQSNKRPVVDNTQQGPMPERPSPLFNIMHHSTPAQTYNIYTDGSADLPENGRGGKAGWAWILDQGGGNGEIEICEQGKVWGPPTAQRAEVMAVAAAMRWIATTQHGIHIYIQTHDTWLT